MTGLLLVYLLLWLWLLSNILLFRNLHKLSITLSLLNNQILHLLNHLSLLLSGNFPQNLLLSFDMTFRLKMIGQLRLRLKVLLTDLAHQFTLNIILYIAIIPNSIITTLNLFRFLILVPLHFLLQKLLLFNLPRILEFLFFSPLILLPLNPHKSLWLNNALVPLVVSLNELNQLSDSPMILTLGSIPLLLILFLNKSQLISIIGLSFIPDIGIGEKLRWDKTGPILIELFDGNLISLGPSKMRSVQIGVLSHFPLREILSVVLLIDQNISKNSLVNLVEFLLRAFLIILSKGLLIEVLFKIESEAIKIVDFSIGIKVLLSVLIIPSSFIGIGQHWKGLIYLLKPPLVFLLFSLGSLIRMVNQSLLFVGLFDVRFWTISLKTQNLVKTNFGFVVHLAL